MLANRIHRFGGPEVIEFEEIVRPEPSYAEVLVRVRSAGVGPWDALIRRGGSALGHSLPLTLGSDLSGTVASVGPGVSSFEIGDEVYGVTNSLFIGAYESLTPAVKRSRVTSAAFSAARAAP